MKKIPLYQVDAFAAQLFKGNPAAVCLLDHWLEDTMMQAIAAENNLAETAFLIPQGDQYAIRWFTPTVEVDLCGHATLASAFVLFEFVESSKTELSFESPRSGTLRVFKEDNQLFLDFPTDDFAPALAPNIVKAIGVAPLEVYKGKTDYIAVVDSETTVRQIKPNFPAIATLDARGLIVTAKGDYCDFVSRFFAPQSGIDEDPVTGSAHTSLTPIWSKKLNKKALTAQQLSTRGGALTCIDKGERCLIGGQAVLYLTGEIQL